MFDATFTSLFAQDTPEGKSRTKHFLKALLNLDVVDLTYQTPLDNAYGVVLCSC